MKPEIVFTEDNIPIEVKSSGDTVPEDIREELVMICIYRIINSSSIKTYAGISGKED